MKWSGQKCDPGGVTGDKDASLEAVEECESHSLKSWAGMGLRCSWEEADESCSFVDMGQEGRGKESVGWMERVAWKHIH